MTPEKAKNIYRGASPLPSGAKSLGEYVDDHRRDCLIQLASGAQVVGNAGVIGNIRLKGRPQEMQGGKRRNVYIDDASWGKAAKIGKGNASDGIRVALSQAVVEG